MIQLKQPLVIALDGHSSCGKSSFAKAIASELGYLYIDSGAMYRAVTWYAMQNGLITNGKVDVSSLITKLSSIDIDFRLNSESLKYETFLNEENIEGPIRSLEVSRNVSEISTIKEVRERLVALQQKMGEKKNIVMDGRDIGTVVFPKADIKIFMTASLEVRTQRRFDELKAKGIAASAKEVCENLARRDYIDQNREESPLAKADDAIILDNSDMTPHQQMEWFFKIIEKYQS
ncbi:MAG: (d)CMP kinase [Bacteroidota bacterium]|nr:(d)CMP kinase [Bacteroidota bacterium]